MLQIPHQLPAPSPAAHPIPPKHQRKRPPQKGHREPTSRLKLEEVPRHRDPRDTTFSTNNPASPELCLVPQTNGAAVLRRYTWRPAARSFETTKLTASPARVPYVRCGARMSRLPVQTASPTLQMMRVLSLGKLGIWPRSCGPSCQLPFQRRLGQARGSIPAGSWCRQR